MRGKRREERGERKEERGERILPPWGTEGG
jgi:hypothetical protein